MNAIRTRFRSAQVGKPTFGDREFIEYSPGTMPLILAAAHGGRLTPKDVPDRTDGVRTSDTNVDKLTRSIAVELQQHQQAKNATESDKPAQPHIVICGLHRKKLDANRPLESACAPDSSAASAWYEYQAAIDEAARRVTDQCGRGLFIEVHGHGHKIQRLELGYLLRDRDFESPVEELNKLAGKTSVREILDHAQLSTNELLRGESSLGARLEAEGIAAVPSNKQSGPGKAEYFNGGWNTLVHGSRDGGTISAIQIECHFAGIRDSDKSIEQSAAKMARAIQAFLDTHYASSK